MRYAEGRPAVDTHQSRPRKHQRSNRTGLGLFSLLPGTRPARCFAGCRRAAILGLTLPTLIAVLPAAHAQAPTFVNGNFSLAINGQTTSAAAADEFGSANNGFTPAQQLQGWSTAGFNFVFLPGTADTTGSTGQFNALTLWGPANSGTNAANLPLSSPTGGDYIGADGAFEVSAITQAVSNLKAGATYAVSFAWAGAQQSSFTGPTTDQWTVSLGSSSQSTKVLSLATEGASGWMNQTFDFIATSSSEVLSFLATGTPSGEPPIALLANVTVTNIPEPSTLTVMATGFAGLIRIGRRRRVPLRAAGISI
jgi:hypothetical protein